MLIAVVVPPVVTAGESVRYQIDTVAGTTDIPEDIPSREAVFTDVEGLAADPGGGLLVVDTGENRVRRIDPRTGRVRTVAGTGLAGYDGDGGNASESLLNSPYGVAADDHGNVYIADFGNGRVRRVSAGGQIETVAGGGDQNSGVPALEARLAGPRNVAAGRAGDLYISDFSGHRVYRITPDGEIAVMAGDGTPGFTGDGRAADTRLRAPAGLAVAPDGSLYVADSGNHRIRRILGSRIMTVLGPEDGLSLPTGLAFDDGGTLYIADSGNRRVLAMAPGGGLSVAYQAPEGAPPVRDVASVEFLFLGGGREILSMSPGGPATRVAGGSAGVVSPAPATETRLAGPIGVAVDPRGGVLIVEESGRRIRRLDPDGMLRVVRPAGGGGGLLDPVAVAADAGGNLWVADYQGHTIYRGGPGMEWVAVTGNGSPGPLEDGVETAAARLRFPRDVARDSLGNLILADSGHHAVRVAARDGVMRTLAGIGVAGYSGDGHLATLAQLDSPSGVAVGPGGEIYIADTGNHIIRVVTPAGLIKRVAGDGQAGFAGDGGPAVSARLNGPTGIAVDREGNLWIADTFNHRVRRVTPDGRIETVAGDGQAGFSGDGGPGSGARLRFPAGIAVSPDGDVYFADSGNRRIRRLRAIEAAPVLSEPGSCRVLHAASYREGPVAPGQLVAIFGEGIGPAQARSAVAGLDGSIARVLGGVTVSFGGHPAPLFYAGPNQVNAQVPYGAEPGSELGVEVRMFDSSRCVAEVPVVPSVPGIFTQAGGAGPAAALNEDGSLNGPDQPARRGEVVVIYATGAGEREPAADPLPSPVLPVEVRIGGTPAEVLYAGAAPGYAGLLQVNVRVPTFLAAGELPAELFVGAAGSQPGVTVSVR